ncbi:MAG: DUF3298 and DUF4163 domain-containing protein [Bacteroidetes bacterium]|nr:DUF3298 and DUF4163 domain-containing protein [Bacteroidota bacterium]
MNKIFLLMISVFLFLTSFSQTKSTIGNKNKQRNKNIVTGNLPKYFYKRFEGKIGDKYSIIMNFIRRDSLVDGDYYYEKKGIPIYFTYESRIDGNGNFNLGEETWKYDTSYMPILSGEFRGKFVSEHKIEGYWKKPGTNVKFDFSLVEKYPDGSAVIELKQYSKAYSNGKEQADICFLFPILKNFSNREIEQLINSDIKNTFLKDYNFGERNNIWKNYNEMMNDFIERYKEFISDTSLPSDYKPMWQNSFTTNIIFNSDNILSLENTEFRFEGGAHPITFFNYKNYDLKTGKEISLNNLFKNDFIAELDKIGEKKFRETYNIKSDESFEKAGYFIGKEGFHLNNNFSILKTGLRFRFGEYEIGPYVLGAPSVFIPYADIKDLINPNGLLAQFIQ